MLIWTSVLIRLALAALLGGLIGLERERKDWAAGIRTHMMVSVGSCLIMIVSAYGFSNVLGGNITLDPSRVAAQVVSGIGFIGAGTILFLKQGAIRGLTTAAGLWTVAAIGLAVGGGLYFAAGVTTLIALFILWALQPLEKVFSRKFKHRTLKIVTTLDVDSTELYNNLAQLIDVKIKNYSFKMVNKEFIFNLKIEMVSNEKMSKLINELKVKPEIIEIHLT